MNSSHRPVIVVGVDGSADSDRAVDWAATVAAAYGADIRLVYALPTLATDLPFWHAEEERERSHGEGVLADARARAEATGVAVTSHAADSAVAPALMAAGEHALMLVLGARGHSAVSGLLLGSVSQNVTRHAPCPVVVVREQADPRATRVVVGVDGAPGDTRAVAFAFEAASRLGRPLVAIFAWHDRAARPKAGPGYWASPDIGERIDTGKRVLAEALAGWSEKFPDVQVTHEAIPVHPTRVLTDASEQAAMVVLGARGRGGFAGLLMGSVTQAVLQHARSPVVVVR
jgi:nucleotide-binding universal stress UspA family protein